MLLVFISLRILQYEYSHRSNANQPVLIILLILLVLIGSNSYLLTEAQNIATTKISVNNARSSTYRPMNNTIDSTSPKLGMIDAKIKCSQLAKTDFSKNS